MTPGAHYHVIDNWCGFTGGEDYGYLARITDADAAIETQKANGNKGGCRHSGSGWLVRPCFDDGCTEYKPDHGFPCSVDNQ